MMPVAFILLAAFLWGCLGPAARFALREGMTGLDLAFVRAAVAGALFAAHAAATGRMRVQKRDLPVLAAFGLLCVSLLEASNLMAVEKGGSGLAAILLYTAPIWVALLSRVFFGERLSRSRALALGVTLAGVAGVALSGGDGESVRFGPEAIFWGGISGLAYALFYVFGKAQFSRYAAETVYLHVFPLGALGLVPFVDFGHFAGKSATAWAAMLFLGVASTFLAYLFYSLGLKRIEPTRASILASIEPVVACIGAYWVWGERFSGLGYFWSAWVIAGVLLAARAGQPETEPPIQPAAADSRSARSPA